jgi:hypothetical protein
MPGAWLPACCLLNAARAGPRLATRSGYERRVSTAVGRT